jgi:hypothetical protein
MVKLNQKEYKDLFKKAEEIKQKLGLTEKVNLLTEKSKYMNGVATVLNNVKLSKPLLKLYKTENEHVLYFMLAHEIIHIRYQDSGWNRLMWGLTSIYSNRSRALILLMEMRANFMANAMLGLSDEEIDEVQRLIHCYNQNTTGKDSYKYGYPDRYKIAHYSKQYSSFSEELMWDLLLDFCEVMKVGNKGFIEDVIRTFKDKCHFNER